MDSGTENTSLWFAAPHENCSLFFQWLHTSSSAIVDLEMWWKRKKKKKFQSMYFFFFRSRWMPTGKIGNPGCKSHIETNDETTKGLRFFI